MILKINLAGRTRLYLSSKSNALKMVNLDNRLERMKKFMEFFYGLGTTMTVPVLSPSGSWLVVALYEYDDLVALVMVKVTLAFPVLRLLDTLQ